MPVTIVSQLIFEMLIGHLIKIEDEIEYVLEKYYPGFTDERNSFKDILDCYVNSLEKIIYNEVAVGNSTSDACPYVLIGSRMTLKNVSTNEIEYIRIISPFNGEVDLDMDSASYLSPVGRAFLLKSLHDEVRVETPGGSLNYKIEAIEPPDDIQQYH